VCKQDNRYEQAESFVRRLHNSAVEHLHPVRFVGNYLVSLPVSVLYIENQKEERSNDVKPISRSREKCMRK